jgi:uncharacterized protein involved in outer membrane biogenesis
MTMARRWLRYGLLGLGSVVVVAVVAVALLAVTFDPNTRKARIVDAMRRATGRDLVLAGPLRLSLGLVPTLQAEDVALANRPGGSRPQMATVARMEAKVALLPLLSRRIEIESVTLERPDILLETDAQGVGNWQFQRPAAPAGTGPATPSHARTAVELHSLVVENGRVTWRDGATGRVTNIDLPRATLTLGDGPTQVLADAQTSGVALHLDGTVGSQAQLTGAVPGPWPVKLSLTAAGATLALDGTATLPLSAQSYHGRVDASVPDLAQLGMLLQRPGLPPLHDVRLGLRSGEGADPLPQDVTLDVGTSDLSPLLPGVVLGRLSLAWPKPDQPGHVTAEGSIAGAPWRLASGLVAASQGVSLRGLSINSPAGDVAGDVTLSQGERWALRGSLVSQHLDGDTVHGLMRPFLKPVPAAPAAAAAASAPVASPPPPRVFSAAPLPWDRLRIADADLQLGIGALHLDGSDYHAVTGHLVLRDGALHLDPFSVQAPEGQVAGTLSVDAAQPEPPVSLTLQSPAFSLNALLQSVGLPGGSEAAVEIDAALRSAGRSPHALASHLDGHVGLALVDGELSNAALTAAVGNLLPPAAGRLDPAGRSHVRCLAVRLNAEAGQASIAALKLDTARLGLEGSGTADLGAETVSLRLRPTVRIGAAGVLAPVRVEGSLEHPAVALDAPSQAGRIGIVIGGLSTAADNCATELTLARDGHPGPLPTAVQVKSAKPADLLRSFLR